MFNKFRTPFGWFIRIRPILDLLNDPWPVDGGDRDRDCRDHPVCHRYLTHDCVSLRDEATDREPPAAIRPALLVDKHEVFAFPDPLS